MQGEFDEFRTYNHVLSTNDIARNKAGGPDSDYGAPLSYEFVIGNTNMVTNTTRQASIVVNFAKAGLQDIASSGCVVYESSNPAAVEVSPAGLLMSHDVGTATITARFNGVAASKDVNVITDITPPTLVRARESLRGSRLLRANGKLFSGLAVQLRRYRLGQSCHCRQFCCAIARRGAGGPGTRPSGPHAVRQHDPDRK
jgi:hypothetical protein